MGSSVAVPVGAVAAPEPEKVIPVAVSNTEVGIARVRSEVELASAEGLTTPLGPNVIPVSVDDGGSEEADVVGRRTTPGIPPVVVGKRMTLGRPPVVVGRMITSGRPAVDPTLLASEVVSG